MPKNICLGLFAEIIAGDRIVEKIWVASAAAEHSPNSCDRKTSSSPFTSWGGCKHCYGGSVPRQFYPVIQMAKCRRCQIPIANFLQSPNCFPSPCGILWPFTWGFRWPSDIWCCLVYKVGLLWAKLWPRESQNFWAFHNLNCILNALAFYLMSMKSKLMQIWRKGKV